MTKHLYIHIPFCNQICSFCDFKRIKSNSYQIMSDYVSSLIKQIKLTSSLNQYTTIYLGGGTPNHLNDDLLENLLSCLDQYLDKSEPYEFSIECNPDLITQSQIDLFKKYHLNRISLGAQILNDKILKLLHRTHNSKDIQNAIDLLYENKINNVSLDFIYNLPNETLKDLDDIFLFIKKNKIKHVSFYALELKTNSILTKSKHQLDVDTEEEQMLYIQEQFKKLNYNRYEVSNWALEKQFESLHNTAYWLSKDWKALGYGASGFEYQHSYLVLNKINQPQVTVCEKLSDKDYYFQILMMGLRLSEGIDVNVSPYKEAYLYFKDKLINFSLENHHLKVNNLDLLDDTLLNLMD